MQFHVVAVFLFAQLITCQAFWWLFGSEEDKNPTEVAQPTSAVEKIFAPFEISETETKFLSEASHYLGNLPKLDQCNLLIINRLKSSCNKLTEVDISKLSVNLLNCQSAVEGRKIYKCTEEMALSECTKEMDPDTWNAYHVVSNRARAVCYSVRQTEFRIKTEITINSLASSAKDNLVSLQHLLDSQKDLSNKTSETFTQVVEGSDKAIKIQTELNVQQTTLKDAITDNIDKLSREKELIENRQEEIHRHSTEVKKDLEEIAGAIQKHHYARTSSDKELLSQVQAIQARAQDVLAKLDKAVGKMDNHYASIEDRHSKIIDNVEDIQKAINFVSEMIVNFEESFHSQMKWINDAVGGTRDKISVISILFGHIVLFAILLVAMLSCGSPVIPKTTLLVLLPTNCVFALQDKHHFTYKEIFLIIALTYPISWIFSIAGNRNCAFSLASALDNVIIIFRRLLLSVFSFVKRKSFSNGYNKSNETRREEKGCEDLEVSDEDECKANSKLITSTPHKSALNSSSDRLHNSTLGSVQRRCGSLTRNGQRCKLYCKRGSHSCARHENSYNSYFEQSNLDSPIFND